MVNAEFIEDWHGEKNLKRLPAADDVDSRSRDWGELTQCHVLLASHVTFPITQKLSAYTKQDMTIWHNTRIIMREVAKPYFYRGMRFSFHASLLSVTKYSDYTNSSHCFTDLPLIRVPRQRGTWRVVVSSELFLVRKQKRTKNKRGGAFLRPRRIGDARIRIREYSWYRLQKSVVLRESQTRIWICDS